MNRFKPLFVGAVAASAAVLGMVSAGLGHAGDDPAFAELDYSAGYVAPATADGHAELVARLAHVVERAATLAPAHGEPLLPPGTRLDDLAFDARRVAQVYLTLPADSPKPVIDDLHGQTIGQVLSGVLDHEPGFGGVAVHLRIGAGRFQSMGAFHPLADREPPAESDICDDTGMTREEAIRNRMLAEQQEDEMVVEPLGLGGPIGHGSTQPQGSLSGVVVFVAAGHGWTAGSSSWYLQRPLLLDMNEDYGNLEQMNFFVNYLYNAGAVVVPFRPVGYQSIEVVLDNDDPGVTFTGSWNDSDATIEYYENNVTISGVPYRWAWTSGTETAVARYTPDLPTTGFYPVYTWVRHGDNRVNQRYRVVHTGGTAEVVIDHARVGNGWIWLGNYYFNAGTDGYVEISNQSPQTGVVIADAIRFGNGMGDIVRPGPDTISGYPRDEEAQRYWAHSEAGNNAVGLPSSIWSTGGSDESQNVGTAARWAQHMNREAVNDQRWRRVYIEFHSNAAGACQGGPPCGAKGTVALIHADHPTQNQEVFAALIAAKVENDMKGIDHLFEFPWGTRGNVIDGSYGAISALNNDDQFDATILEVAFHDNVEDAANLRNVKVRDAVARSTMQSIIDFLSNTSIFPDTQVVKLYPPDPPLNIRAVHSGNGNVVVSWTPPSSQPGGGAPPLGYRIYRSSNGYGFGNPVTVSNIFGQVSTRTLTDIPANTTTYLRVAAWNNGGESMPSEVVAVRHDGQNTSDVLIVDGYTRVTRHQNFIQMIPQGPMERPIPHRVNSFDYVVQHAEALTDHGFTFDACTKQNVIGGQVPLGNYDAVVWFSGQESDVERTFNSTAQTLVTNYLDAGGMLFATGSEIGWDLAGMGQGTSFFENQLGAVYLGNDAGTFEASGSGGILGSIGTFDFDPINGAVYEVKRADRISAGPGAVGILNYVGGTGDSAAIQFDTGAGRVVLFGFPFETISSAAVRSEIMGAVMDYFRPPADFDGDGDVDMDDYAFIQACLTGSMMGPPAPGCESADLDGDQDVDEDDIVIFLGCMSGANLPLDPNCLP